MLSLPPPKQPLAQEHPQIYELFSLLQNYYGIFLIFILNNLSPSNQSYRQKTFEEDYFQHRLFELLRFRKVIAW